MFPVPALPDEAVLVTALNDALIFARSNISNPRFRRPFVAIGGGQTINGIWIPTGNRAQQVLLLSVRGDVGKLQPLWVTRPTGIMVLEGSFIATTVTPPTDEEGNGGGSVVQHFFSRGQVATILERPVKYSIDPLDAACHLLVARFRPFPNTPQGRMTTHAIREMGEKDSEQLYGRMKRLLLG